MAPHIPAPPPLPFPYHQLEPFLAAGLVATHHTHHHAACLAAQREAEHSLARALQPQATAAALSYWDAMQRYQAAASGVALHALYWDNLHPGLHRPPTGDLLARLRRDFGFYEAWAEDFLETARGVACGWALLVHDPSSHRLRNVAVEGHSQGAVWGALPLVACDLWPHAYAEQYGTRRDDYVRAFVDWLDWRPIADRLYRSPFGIARPRGPVGGVPVTPLPFAPDALRGISSQSVRWHHTRFEAAHVQARNQLEEALRQAPPPAPHAELQRALTHHAAGHFLHELMWEGLGGGGGAPEGELHAALEYAFGAGESWWAEVRRAAEGSHAGWLVLAWEPAARRLRLLAVEGHSIGALWGSTPIWALDLWEHAYFYDRGPERTAYLAAVRANLRWPAIQQRFARRLS